MAQRGRGPERAWHREGVAQRGRGTERAWPREGVVVVFRVEVVVFKVEVVVFRVEVVVFSEEVVVLKLTSSLTFHRRMNSASTNTMTTP